MSSRPADSTYATAVVATTCCGAAIVVGLLMWQWWQTRPRAGGGGDGGGDDRAEAERTKEMSGKSQEQSGVWSGRGSGSAEFSALERRNRELEELLASEQARGQAAAVAHADLQAQLTATTQGLLSAQSALVDLHKKNSGEKDSGDKEMKELRDDLNTTMRDLVSAQGALVEMHQRRSRDRADAHQGAAALRTELRAANKELRTAQTALVDRSREERAEKDLADLEIASLKAELERLAPMEEQLRTGRVELGAAQLRASELEGAMADMEKTHREQLQSQGTASSKALSPVSSSSAAATPSMRSPMSSRAAEMRNMFADAPGPQWEDVVIPREAIELCCEPGGELAKLGGGASGQVYRARVFGTTSCACKVFELTTEQSKLHAPQYFIQEVRTLWRIQHPYITHFYGACMDGGKGYLLMELMQGGDLASALNLPLPGGGGRMYGWYARGETVALQVATALAFLHSHRTVHLDLKSRNILLTRDGKAKIGDVGFSRVMLRDVLSSLGDRLGTWDWCAPEVLLGQPATEKADIYSFGIVVFEIITGEPPRRGTLRPLVAPQDAPEEVIELFKQCTDAEPAARPSAAEVAQTLLALRIAAKKSRRQVGRQGAAPAPGPAAEGAAQQPEGEVAAAAAGGWDVSGRRLSTTSGRSEESTEQQKLRSLCFSGYRGASPLLAELTGGSGGEQLVASGAAMLDGLHPAQTSLHSLRMSPAGSKGSPTALEGSPGSKESPPKSQGLVDDSADSMQSPGLRQRLTSAEGSVLYSPFDAPASAERRESMGPSGSAGAGPAP